MHTRSQTISLKSSATNMDALGLRSTRNDAPKNTLIIQTRSQCKKTSQVELFDYEYIQPVYEVNIDFDEASKEWRSNKKSIGNGMYEYKHRMVKNNIKTCWEPLDV